LHFRHSDDIWSGFPELLAGVLLAQGVSGTVSVEQRLPKFQAIAQARLATSSEGELPEIQAWRRAFSRMGLKPTQYRCASEQLLRRFKKEGSLPRIHPLIDLCNAISLAFAIPIAVFDLARIDGPLEVRRARGDEAYLAFSGEVEHPEPDEVIFADAARNAHARRWTHRQSARSAVRPETATVLIVAEAMHETAQHDIARLTATIAEELDAIWSITGRIGAPSRSSPLFAL
jgi:DNA/RNA-binding domain of Phe-tRNA-synthetase-like protein